MTRALIVVDVQNDFITGSLPVPGAKEVIRPINNLIAGGDYKIIIFTQDWHPKNHISFTTWPSHCVQGTKGAAFAPHINHNKADIIIRKGTNREIDSYSVFADDNGNSSGLGSLLLSRGVKSVDVVGLALDFCVKSTALDAAYRGLVTSVRVELTRAVNSGNVSSVVNQLTSNGVGII